MSKVTQVTVRYGRSVQPKPYESKEGFLEAVLVADEGENIPQDEIEVVFAGLIASVHEALGLNVANSADEPPKKTRKTRRTKKQMAQDEAEAAAASGNPHSDNVDGEKEDVIDEASVEGAKKATEVPVEGDEVAHDAVDVVNEKPQEVDDAELQGAASRAAGTYGAAVVKGLMKEFGVTLLGKLEQEKRSAFLTKLDELGD